MNLRSSAREWVETCKFFESHDPKRVVVFQIDRLSAQQEEMRLAAMGRIFNCVGEESTPETDRFVRRWPTVHKVKPAAERKFALIEEMKSRLLEEVPGLQPYMRKMGYSDSDLAS